jgi:hypothetical protein
MMPTKSFSQSTMLNLTESSQPSPQLMQSTAMPSKPPKIRMRLLSGHNNDNNPGDKCKTTAIAAIEQGVKASTEAITAAGQHSRITDQIFPETVSSVSTAKILNHN